MLIECFVRHTYSSDTHCAAALNNLSTQH